MYHLTNKAWLRTGIFVMAIAMTSSAFSPANAQEKASDRYRYIAPDAETTDDPRRLPVPPGYLVPEGSIVLKGGRVFDGTGAATRPATIVIEGKTITAILPPNSTDWPQDANVIDVSGQTVLPGLIDLHVHLSYTEWPTIPTSQAVDVAHGVLRGVERLRYFIESGITSVRDTGSQGMAPFYLKEWVAQNRLPGPRVFAAGQLITGTGGHGAEGYDIHSAIYGEIYEASGPDGFRDAVRIQFKNGADFIKLGSHYSREEVQAAVNEAHALGLHITADAETFYIQWAVEAGIDAIEHPLPRSDNTIRLMATNGTHSVPTLLTYQIIFDTKGAYYGSTSRRFTFTSESMFETFKKMRDAGVLMGVGTDLINHWYRSLPDAYIEELKWFEDAGYSAPEALVAATRTGAVILDMEDKLGTLEEGKLADVLVVNGRPDENLDDLANVSLVIRNGIVMVEDGRVVIEPHVPIPLPSYRN
jgi:imidazolonepropionase-like amidohydrolase